MGLWSIWSGSLGNVPYWDPYGAITVPIVMAMVLGTLGWLTYRSANRG